MTTMVDDPFYYCQDVKMWMKLACSVDVDVDVAQVADLQCAALYNIEALAVLVHDIYC